jgi:hypothetical protein
MIYTFASRMQQIPGVMQPRTKQSIVYRGLRHWTVPPRLPNRKQFARDALMTLVQTRLGFS